ncbi:MAG: hypothetical protein GY870_20375, partial [archaeon]|nr:hypothetical protein [archaeon]
MIIEEVRIGGTFAVTAELVYVYNSTVSNPIANQTILLTLNYSEPFQVLLETGENGRGSYEMYINEYHTGKTFTTEANFTGTEIYLPCYQIEESIILGKYEVNLTIENPPSAVQVGYNATYIMNISIEENKNAERLIYLSAFYDDENLAFLTRELYSDSNGTILYTFDEILNNHNNITIYFEFLGTAQIKSSIVNFTSQIIPKWNSSILIENLPEEIRRGQTIVINLTLFSEDFGFSESFAGEPINFIFNFSNVVVEIYTYYLDENASIILEYIIPESEVTMFNISVSYLGTNKILECEVNSDKIILPKKDTGLVIETFFGEQVFSGTYYCSANLTDENNNPLANVNITFQLFNSKQELIGTFSGVTGINGYVSVTIELLEAGDYTILAIFEGESIYAANESLAFNVHVVTPISLFIENLPFILLITVLIVFGNLVLYRTVLLPRKNRRLEELKAIHQRFSDAENIQYILILTQGGLSLFS